MNRLATDLRDAVRSLRRTPASTAIALAILALAIGGTTTLWQALDAVVLRPLPFSQPQQLITIYDLNDGRPWPPSPSNFADYREQAASLSSVAAWSDGGFALSGDEGPAEMAAGVAVTGDFFATLGVEAELGRTLQPADDDERVVVLGHDLWRRRYGGDPAIVGRAIRVDGVSRTVVGVLGAGRGYPLDSRLWVPLKFSEEELRTQRGAHYLGVLARLREGATLATAQAELAGIAARLAVAHPNTNDGLSATTRPLRESVVRRARTTLALMLGAVALLLVAACANLANVSLARSVARTQELAVRASLGAGGARLARGLLVENVVLAGAGALLGGALSVVLLGALPRWLGDLPRLEEARLDAGGILALVALTGVAGVLLGLGPASFALRRDPIEALRSGRSVAGSRSAGRLRRTLVVVTSALALVLAAGASLLQRSYQRVSEVDAGFARDGRLLFSVSLPDGDYATPEARAGFVRELEERLAALPGVERVGATFGQPFGDFGYQISVRSIDGQLLPDDNSRRSPAIRFVTPDYFRALGVPLRAGRAFEPGDRFGAPNVAIANEAAVRLVFQGEEALGRTLEIGTSGGQGRGRVGGEVVGIVGDVREQQLDDDPLPTLYFAIEQFPVGFLTFVVQASPDRLAGLAAPVNETVAALDPDLPVFRQRTLDELVADSLARRRALARLLIGVAAIAVTLAALGLFGVLTQMVAERRRELALRGALGATPAELARLVLAQAGALAALGLAGGLLAATVLARFLREQLYEISPTDPPTLAAAALLLLAVSLLAGWLPARRALRVDPMTVLRDE